MTDAVMPWVRRGGKPPQRSPVSIHAPEESLLQARLEALGVRPISRLRLTDNHTVMVSFSRQRVLGVHRGYAQAPDRVLRAIVRFVAPGTPRALRKAAEHEIVSFHVARNPGDALAVHRAQGRPQPGDLAALERLAGLFRSYNARYFQGMLPALPIRLSGRMRARLGHLSLDREGRPAEITISRRHLTAHGWTETAHTLLHEMVHVWQHAIGHRVDHGPAFRAKAREVGAHAAARRWVRRERAGRRS